MTGRQCTSLQRYDYVKLYLRLCAFLIERKSGVNLGGDAAWNDGQDCFSKLDELKSGSGIELR